MGDIIQSLEASLHRGFIDKQYRNVENYKPRLLVNNSVNDETVLSPLLDELDNCKSFIFSVAFITESGLATLKSHLLDLKTKGIKGRILTSTYLNFNQPKVFKELRKIKNVEVRLTDLDGFHSKGYIFNHGSYYSLIVGSSNITAQALKVNYEWNIKLTSLENGEIVHHFNRQFDEIWSKAHVLSEDWITKYEEEFKSFLSYKPADKIAEFPVDYNINAIKEAISIVPNKMQQAALQEIRTIRESGKEKGLIISATGTGKTYLSAFDVRRFSPRRMLFIVHREQILNKAMSDFKRVLGGDDNDFGILSGSSKQVNAKYLFATIQTISKEGTLDQFDKGLFDYVLIDEVHKAGANSYLKVINHFKPKFFMGMTATPERTDDFNIYELFDYNVAYEIRLQEALEEDMLCPFHYFGVTDLEYNGETIDDATVLSKLVTDERVNHIIDKVNYYGFSGEQVKGLIFCSRKDEAKQLSIALNGRGIRTVALTGDDTQKERMLRVSQLENGLLDYILTVDIFNEGIDIPCINQVVMLRQTQSSIIFIQQLGRGLRKHDSKDFVTIIDFIGNYKNNYLIPVALSGDQSQNKDNIRRHMKDTSYIKGISTINFEEIAKQQIFKSINNSNLTAMKVFKDAFIELKNKIGRVPYLFDFISNHSIDPGVIVGKLENYYQFLLKMKVEIPVISSYENQVLSMLSLEILNGKRPHELILLELLLKNDHVSYEDYVERLHEFGCYVDNETINSVIRIFQLTFFNETDRKKYGEIEIVVLSGGNYSLNMNIKDSLKSNSYFKHLVYDVLKSAWNKNKQFDQSNPLSLYKKYSKKDVCRLLNWTKDEKGTIFGYRPKHNTCPIFVTYHKKDVESSIDYKDEILSPEVFKWYTRSNRTLDSKEVKEIIYSEEKNNDIHIFIKKDDDEGTDFYYIGKAAPDKKTVQQDTMMNDKGRELPVVHMNLVMENSIENKLYHYLRNENIS